MQTDTRTAAEPSVEQIARWQIAFREVAAQAVADHLLTTVEPQPAAKRRGKAA